MKKWGVLAIALALASYPLPAAAAHGGAGVMASGLTGSGLVFQPAIGQDWQLRLVGGIWTAQNPDGWKPWCVGGGVRRELGEVLLGRSYALLGGGFTWGAINSYTLDMGPGLGMQWGPFFLEAGVSFWRFERWDPRDDATRYPEWGYSLALGSGLLLEF